MHVQDPSYTTPHNPHGETEYAGFWRRLAAYLIDGFILTIPNTIISSVTGFKVAGKEYILAILHGEQNVSLFTRAFLFYILWVTVLSWLYFALLESSSKQATLGKMAMGIKVTDLQGHPLSFGEASGRYFAKIISGMTFGIGYIMAAFTKKSQALHDLIAGTLVVKGRPD